MDKRILDANKNLVAPGEIKQVGHVTVNTITQKKRILNGQGIHVAPGEIKQTGHVTINTGR